MKSVLINHIANNIAPKSPRAIRVALYKRLGLINSEEIRKNVFIQNIKALSLGKNTFINSFCKFYNGFDSTGKNGKITIGSNVTVGYGVSIFTTTHIIGSATHRADYNDIKYLPVNIEDGTWICANCTILPGVRIGRGCVIAAGSVVISDCESYCMYGGNPARKIKSLKMEI